METREDWNNLSLSAPEEVSLTSGEGIPTRKEQSENSGQIIWRIVNLMMTIFFLLAAGVQFNDPDPYLWVPLYGTAAALTCSVAAQPTLSRNKMWQIVYWLHCLFCLGMFVYVLVELFITVANSAAEAINPLMYEEGRELAGILITASWLFVCKQSPVIEQSTSVGKKKAGATMSFLIIFSFLPLFLWGLCYSNILSSPYFSLCTAFWENAHTHDLNQLM